MNRGKKKLLIFVISYKASHRLYEVYNKIPFKELKRYKTKILFSDDNSDDDTFQISKKIKKKNNHKKIIVNQNKTNLGYGAHIKQCLRYALKNKFDYAVMIHGDCQFNPKYIPNLLKNIRNKKNISACTGSRIKSGATSAFKGGMPFYKLIGNILLTKLSNSLLNTNFTDAHTGLWAYNLKFVKINEVNRLTNSFNFDQEFRFNNTIRKRKILEISIKTKYGDERSQLHVKYAFKFFLNTFLFFLIKNRFIISRKFI